MKLVTFTHGGIDPRRRPHRTPATSPTSACRCATLLDAGDLSVAQTRRDQFPPPRSRSKHRCRSRAGCIAIGLNYRDHAEEANQPIPQRPIVFTKSTRCVVGPGDDVFMPRLSRAVDWEAELVIVIGKTARHVNAADAEKYVAGYCCGNDISVRDWQFHAPTWVMGKSFDTHGPIGPWLVTPDEVDPSATSTSAAS